MPPLGGRFKPGTPEYRAAVRQQNTSQPLRRALRPLRSTPIEPPSPHGSGWGQPTSAPVRHKERINAQGNLVPNVHKPRDQGLPIDQQHGPGVSGPGFGPDRVAALRDQARLLNTALNPQVAPNHRLSALRELRVRHGIPTTNRDYINAITPHQSVHQQSFLHKALHAVTGGLAGTPGAPRPLGDYLAVKGAKAFPGALGRLGQAQQRNLIGVGTNPYARSNQRIIESGFVDPQRVAGALVGLSDKAASALINLKLPGGGGGLARAPGTPLGNSQAFLKNTARDVLDLPAQTLASVYLTATDPKSLVTSTLDTVKHPVRAFVQHPVSTALILRGGEGALSRGLGAAARAAPKAAAAHEVAVPGIWGYRAANRDRPHGANYALDKGYADAYGRAYGAEPGKSVPPTQAVHIRATKVFDLRDPARVVELERAFGHSSAVDRVELQHDPAHALGTTDMGLRHWMETHGYQALRRTEGKGVMTVFDESTVHPNDQGVPARAAPRGGALERLGTTRRPGLRLVGNAQLGRHYSKGLIEKGGQVLADRRLAPALDAEGNPVLDRRGMPLLEATHRQKFGPTGVGGALGRRLDIAFGSNMTNLRNAREAAYHEMYKKGVAPVSKSAASYGTLHHGADLTPLISEGIIKTGNETRARTPHSVEDDLRAHRNQIVDHIEQHGHTMLPAQLADSEANLEIINRLLADKKFLAKPEPAIKAAAHYAAEQSKAETLRAFFQDLNPRQARRRALLPFAVREMGARPLIEDGKVIRFEKAGGGQLTDKEIIDEFRQRGGDPSMLAYVPQKPNFKGAQNFGPSPGLTRPGADARRFTGGVTAPAAYQRDYEVLAQSLVRSATRVARHKGTNAIIDQFGAVHPKGGFFETPDQANAYGRSLEQMTGERWTAFSAGRKDAIGELAQHLDPAQLPHVFTEAVPGDRNNVYLLPESVIKRYVEHVTVSARGPALRMNQAVLQRFRHVVLPTSPRWPVGNVAEMELRIGLHDPTMGAKSIPLGLKHEGELRFHGGKDLVENVRSAAAAGHFGSQRTLDINREPTNKIVKWFHTLRNVGVGPKRVVGPKAFGDAWDGYKKLIFGANERMESGIYFSGLDRFARQQVQELTGSWLKTLDVQGKAYQEVYKAFLKPDGKIDYNTINDFANMLDEMRGRYSNLSPRTREIVSNFTPFAPWYINSLYFALVTLPARHPVKTAILAGAYNASEPKRMKLGLTQVPVPGAPKQLPGYLQGSIPFGKGLGRYNYLPFGAWSDPLGNASNLVIPQYDAFLKNLAGFDWKNQPLKGPKGAKDDIGTRALIALNTAAQSFAPFVRQLQQLREHGGSAYNTSTIAKPQIRKNTGRTGGGTANKILNPFFVTPRSNIQGKKGTTGWGSSSSSQGTGWGAPASSGKSGWGP